MTTTFPTISEARRRELLAPPDGVVRVVIDTDTKNEIDDQFALAWALLSQDVLQIEAVYAEPYSFIERRDSLLQTMERLQSDREVPPELARYHRWAQHLLKEGIDLEEIPFADAATGMEESYQEILTVYEKLQQDPAGKVFRGSDRYLPSLSDPVRSPAAEHLVELALSGGEEPLYVAAIGCVTNVASALLMEPEIIKHIVVLWTSGYPSHVRLPNHSFNLEQDVLSSQLLYDSGVPLVYLPGFHVGAQLQLSLPEMEAWVKDCGQMGAYLYWLYTHNPSYERRGISDHFGRTWIIWDLINIAWLLNPEWVPSDLVVTPVLGDDKVWQPGGEGRHLMREAYGVDRDAIFRDFLFKLQNAP